MVSYVMGIQVFFLGLILLLLSVAAANAANHEILGTLRIGGVFPILSENDKLDVVGVMRMVRNTIIIFYICQFNLSQYVQIILIFRWVFWMLLFI
jgi:hypothetical protein